jgi:hypothetical protein
MFASCRMACAAVRIESRRQTSPLDVCPVRPSTATIDFPASLTTSEICFDNCCHAVAIGTPPEHRVFEPRLVAHHPNGQVARLSKANDYSTEGRLFERSFIRTGNDLVRRFLSSSEAAEAIRRMQSLHCITCPRSTGVNGIPSMRNALRCATSTWGGKP